MAITITNVIMSRRLPHLQTGTLPRYATDTVSPIAPNIIGPTCLQHTGFMNLPLPHIFPNIPLGSIQ